MNEKEHLNSEDHFNNIADNLFGSKRKRKGIKGKSRTAKGSDAERKVAHHMRAWTGYDFNRVPRSGGLRWQNASLVAGDVICEPDKFFPFILEVKNNADLKLKDKMPAKAPVFQYWRQVTGDCERIGKRLPLLFCREDGMPAKGFYDMFLFVSAPVKDILGEFGLSPEKAYTLPEGYDIFWIYVIWCFA